jgi:hypothetical protein
MKRVLVGIVIAMAMILIYQSWNNTKEDKSILKENSMLIQEQIKNVSKLIVTEGHFSEVYTYKDSQKLFGSFFTADKKALVVVNAEVIVAYDLQQMNFEVDESSKTLRILNIPEPEIKINPDFEYYDVTADYLNRFSAEDYNKIKNNVNASLLKKVKASSLLKNAENRLMSELSRFLILTQTLGWTLTYDNKVVKEDIFENFPGH